MLAMADSYFRIYHSQALVRLIDGKDENLGFGFAQDV
jgi:hypothetical protein